MAMGGGDSGGDFGEINITPLTDVFMILFLLMIVIAPMINEKSLPIAPPSSKNGNSLEQSKIKPINIEVSKEGLVAINNKKLSEEPIEPEQMYDKVLEELNKIREDEKFKKSPLNIVADAETKQKYLVGVLDAASGAGIKKLNIVTVSRK